jgi:hypothetical protein
MTESTGSEPALVATPVVEEITSTAESTPAVTDANVKPVPPPEEPVQKRIDKLTWQARQAERDRDYWRQQAQQTPAKPAAEPEKPKEPPKLADFDFDEVAYQKALTEHVSAEAARQVREEFRKEQEQLTQQQKAESWRKRETEFAAKTPDYEETAYYAPIPDKAAEIIKDCENGPQIAYYLGKHLDEAQALNGLSEAAMARAIGRIEAKLEAPEVPPAPAPAPKPVSKAPPPPPKIEATEPAISKSWNDPSLSQEEFNKRRRQVIAQRR